jgi:tRNA(Ser,Leu) C12 N-acetylase TAN1
VSFVVGTIRIQPKGVGTRGILEMRDWNVVVTIHDKGFILACELLGEFGRIEKTAFFNVLVMRVEDVREFLDGLQREISENRTVLNFLARVIPVGELFDFRTPEEFESRAKEIALYRVPLLADKSFHVRIHRRGFKGRLSSMEEERLIADVLLDALEKAGTPGRITFENPDAVLAVEILGQQAGLSLLHREELERYSFLRLG